MLRVVPSHRSRRLALALVVALALLSAWLVIARAPAERAPRSPDLHQTRTVASKGSGALLEASDTEPASADHRQALKNEEPGPVLLVTVVDARDQPIGGIELELLMRTGSSVEPIARASSRPGDGAAKFILERSKAHADAFRLVCRASFVPAVFVDLSGDLPEQPVVLRLPAHGSIDVLLLRDGEPIRHSAEVELRLVGHPEVPPRRIAASAGRAHFEAVGTGLVLELQASCDESGLSEPVIADGPRNDGERVSVALSLGPVWPRVRLRVVDAGGAPIIEESFEGWVDYGNRATPLNRSPRSDEQGWLEFYLPGDPTEPGRRALVLRSIRTQDSRPKRLEIPDPLVLTDVNDLGLLSIDIGPGPSTGD